MHKIFPETLVYLEIISNFALAIEKNGSLAQLNRASDYGSEGYRFESYASHFFKFVSSNLQNGSLAQLNRASDYGSEGYRFESYASHISGDYLMVFAFFMPAYFSFLDGASETDIDQYPVLCVVLSHKMDDKAVLVSL